MCSICLDAEPPPIQSGCACRGDAGLAHVQCRADAASYRMASARLCDGWQACATCKQQFTGAMQMGLAVAWRAQDDTGIAEANMGNALIGQGKYAEAATVLVKVLAADLLGHLNRLKATNSLAVARSGEGKHAEAEAIYRELLAAVFEDTEAIFALRSSLGAVLYDQGKLAEAIAIGRVLLADVRRVLGPEHSLTLNVANDMIVRLGQQGKYDEAEIRDLWAVRKRVLGPEHPDTLVTAGTLAVALGAHGRYAEAASLHRKVLAVQLRIMGPEHPHTLTTADNLANALSRAPRCYVCCKPAPKKCSACKVATYCSKVCQKKHWHGQHKNDCVGAPQ